jgi:DNA-binding XRE family transcriptional regulator
MSSPEANAARRKARRAELRDQLYARVDRGDIGLAEALRMMRKIAGKTQTDYAHLVGVSPRVLMNLERGAGNPTLKTLHKLFAPFGLELTVRRRRESAHPRPAG